MCSVQDKFLVILTPKISIDDERGIPESINCIDDSVIGLISKCNVLSLSRVKRGSIYITPTGHCHQVSIQTYECLLPPNEQVQSGWRLCKT